MHSPEQDIFPASGVAVEHFLITRRIVLFYTFVIPVHFLGVSCVHGLPHFFSESKSGKWPPLLGRTYSFLQIFMPDALIRWLKYVTQVGTTITLLVIYLFLWKDTLNQRYANVPGGGWSPLLPHRYPMPMCTAFLQGQPVQQKTLSLTETPSQWMFSQIFSRAPPPCAQVCLPCMGFHCKQNKRGWKW